MSTASSFTATTFTKRSIYSGSAGNPAPSVDKESYTSRVSNVSASSGVPKASSVDKGASSPLSMLCILLLTNALSRDNLRCLCNNE